MLQVQDKSIYDLQQSYKLQWLRKGLESYKPIKVSQNFARSERHQRKIQRGGQGNRELYES